VKSVLLLFWARLGSLNAVESVKQARLGKRCLGRAISKADTVARVYTELGTEALRAGI